MNRKLYIGFKGKYNSSSILVRSISADSYLLTNSFVGLKRDIDSLGDVYDNVILIGIDKNLKDAVRIETVAENGTTEFSAFDIENISTRLNQAGIKNYLSNKPTKYLCNNAYWHLLRKYNRNVVLLHIPSIKNLDECFIESMKQALTQ